MNLEQKINDAMKMAMKAGEKEKLITLRSIRALILEFQKSGSEKKLDEKEEINILSSAAKKRKDAIEQYENADRKDLADKERYELAIIEEFLPKQLSEDEVVEEVKKIAAETGAKEKKDFPKLMPAAIKALKGKADGKVIKSAVEKVLGN